MFFADWFLSYNLRKSKQNEYSVWNDIFQGKVDSDVVIYGSSRAMVHVDPRIIKDSLNLDAYNLGLNGHNFWLQYYRHLEYLKHNRKPLLIIHSVDMFTLVKRQDLFQMDQFLPYMLYNRELEKWIKSYKGFSHYDYNIPLVRYYGQFKAIGSAIKTAVYQEPSNTDSLRYKGFISKNLAWNDDLVKARRAYPNYMVKVDSASVKLFDQYLNECRAEGIPVVLVYSPEYIEGQDFVKNRDEVMGVFKFFAAKYNIPFLDYSDDPISHKQEYFYNASHLNGIGAAFFTNRLIHDMRSGESTARLLIKGDKKDVHQAVLKDESVEFVLN